MMKMITIDKQKIIIGALVIVILVLLGLTWHNTKQVDTIEIPIEVHDTITVEKERIVEHTKVKYVTKFDTVYQVIDGRDTIKIPVELPIEHKVYQDTIRTDTTEIALDIKYSGFKPSLDEVGLIYHLNTKRAVETKNKAKFGQYFGVGFSVGAGAGFNPLTKAPSLSAPEVSISLQYGFGITW